MRERAKQLNFRMTEAEYNKLRRLSSKAGTSMRSYMCQLIKNRVPKEIPPPDYFKFLDEVRKIGNSIHQIAAVAVATSVINEEKYKEDIDSLISILMQLRKEVELPQKV